MYLIDSLLISYSHAYSTLVQRFPELYGNPSHFHYLHTLPSCLGEVFEHPSTNKVGLKITDVRLISELVNPHLYLCDAFFEGRLDYVIFLTLLNNHPRKGSGLSDAEFHSLVDQLNSLNENYEN